MKKTILIFALSRTQWIGGIYYRKNIVNMMLANAQIRENFRIVVLINHKHRSVFLPFGSHIELVCCPDETGTVGAMFRALLCCLRYRVKYVFPIRPFFFFRFLGITPVSWIADFQHCHYPEFFSAEERQIRDQDFGQMAAAGNPLVLSSNAALEDFRRFFAPKRNNVFVVPFTSFIEDEIKELGSKEESLTLQKYGLECEKYAIVCNQFWKHKGHTTVLKAIKLLVEQNREFGGKVVFTGALSDRRNPEYIEEVRALMEDPMIAPHIKLLGFIDRAEQLCIMKHAHYIIQPSLFEGWGTVVEDGKVLNKRILLSDIPVHKEQMNTNCVLFNAQNEKDLAEKMIQLFKMDIVPAECAADKTVEYGRKLESIFR